MSTLHPIGEHLDNPQANVVFVHGLGGHWQATWAHDARRPEDSWPYWLAREFPCVRVWSLEYEAAATRWARVVRWFGGRSRHQHGGSPLTERGQEALGVLRSHGLHKRPLILIGHSLGGLVIKAMLLPPAKVPANERIRKARAVMFLATPHHGAVLANWTHRLSWLLRPGRNVEELRDCSRSVERMYRDYATQCAGIQTRSFSETKRLRGLFVVDCDSATHCDTVCATPVDADHCTIARPTDQDAVIFVEACKLLRRHAKCKPTCPGGSRTAPPFQTPPPAEPFLGRCAERQRLAEALASGHFTAVLGEAGLGKSALAAAVIRDMAGSTGEQLATSPFPDGVVWVDLHLQQAEAPAVFAALADGLGGADFRRDLEPEARAREACGGKRYLLVLDGGEAAYGAGARLTRAALQSVLSPANRVLVLSRSEPLVLVNGSLRLAPLADADALALLKDAADPATGLRLTEAVALRGNPLAALWLGRLLAHTYPTTGVLPDPETWQTLPTGPASVARELAWPFGLHWQAQDAPSRRLLAATGALAWDPWPRSLFSTILGEDQVDEALEDLEAVGFVRPLPELGDFWQLTERTAHECAASLPEAGELRPGLEQRAVELHTHYRQATPQGDYLRHHVEALRRPPTECPNPFGLTPAKLEPFVNVKEPSGPPALSTTHQLDARSLLRTLISRMSSIPSPSESAAPGEWQLITVVRQTLAGYFDAEELEQLVAALNALDLPGPGSHRAGRAAGLTSSPIQSRAAQPPTPLDRRQD